MVSKIEVLLVSNEGGGFADKIQLDVGTKVADLFAQKFPNRDASGYNIRVNRAPCSADQELHDGDRITVTPNKIDGAN